MRPRNRIALLVVALVVGSVVAYLVLPGNHRASSAVGRTHTTTVERKNVDVIKPYVGTWYAHSTVFKVKSSGDGRTGTGTLVYRDYRSCPLPTSPDNYMCNIIDKVDVTPAAGGATITVISSYAAVSDGSRTFTTGAYGVTDHLTYAVTSVDNGIIVVNMSNTPYADGVSQLCLSGSQAQMHNTCGA